MDCQSYTNRKSNHGMFDVDDYEMKCHWSLFTSYNYKCMCVVKYDYVDWKREVQNYI